jgi:hypothetical protein
MKKNFSAKTMLILTALAVIAGTTGAAFAQAPRFEVTLSPAAAAGPVTGRLVLFISKSADREPRLALSMRGPALLGVDVNGLMPGVPVVVDDGALAYPFKLSEIPAGDYFVQAVINVYTQVHRADGKTIWVHLNDGRQEFFGIAPGNPMSAPQPVHIGTGGTVKVEINKVIPDRPLPEDTEWIKHVKIQSKKLTEFWGQPIFIHATVLLPKGYADHPDHYYPTLYTFGHGVPFFFSTEPPTGERDDHGAVNPVTGLKDGYESYKEWNGDNFPRFIAVTFEQQTPYFPDSYSVNSANNGPYGDALVGEIMPYLEDHFRMIKAPYARHLEGASTNGWQTLALQLQHPDMFGGAWVLQPDPIDFTSYITVNIYEDENAFSYPLGPFVSAERYFQRSRPGQPLLTMKQLSLFEEVLGTRARGAGQLGIWEAVYGPTDADGYPAPLWDKLTGKIDHTVAGYMRDHGYDLRAYAEKNWATLGPKLQGKLHFFCGDMDDYWLNLAVYKFEDFLKSTTSPKSDATFTYGRPMKGHSWHAWTWMEFVRIVAETVKKNAPAGTKTCAWNY